MNFYWNSALWQVGFIEVDKEDKQEYSFRIQVQGRLYNLRASSRASCRDWVITLNRVKEASMQQGNVKLVVGNLSSIDLLNNKTSNINSPTTHGGTPRVVVVSNRQRTRAVDPDEEEPWGDQLIRVVDDGEDRTDPAYNARRSALSTVVAARWTKHQSSLQRLGTKLSAWARSLKKYSCATTNMEGQPQPNAVYLDRHVHPPGHDDKFDKTKAPSSAKMTMQPYEISPRKKEFNSWLETESALAASTAAALPLDEDEQQLATGSAKAAILPLAMADRSSSMASSDYDSRMLS